MSDPTDVFNNQKPAADPQPEPTQSSDQLMTKLAEIKDAEGKQKYSTVEKALEGTKAAQDFIETLKQEKAQLEEEMKKAQADLAQKDALEDLVEKLKPSTPATPAATPAPEAQYDEGKVLELIQASLQADKQKSEAQTNRNKVNEALSAKYGDKVSEIITSKAAELGTTPEALGKLSEENPNMVLAFFPETPKPSNPAVQNSYNTQLTPGAKPPEAPAALNLLKGSQGDSDKNQMFQKAKQETLERLGVVQ